MIGPSSSHTAGAVRLGRMVRSLYGKTPFNVKLGLHGSFAQTYIGHGTDRALLSGLMGWDTDDARIPNAHEFAQNEGMHVEFFLIELGDSAHPNSVFFQVSDENKETLQVTGCSVGGGRICVNEVNGFPIELTGEYHTLVTFHRDRPGVIHRVSGVLADRNINVAQMKVSRQKKGTSAVMVLEIDGSVDEQTLQTIAALDSIDIVRKIDPV